MVLAATKYDGNVDVCKKYKSSLTTNTSFYLWNHENCGEFVDDGSNFTNAVYILNCRVEIGNANCILLNRFHEEQKSQGI